MKILTIICKEFLESIRDFKSILLIIFMPLLLTFILSLTFKNELNNSIDLSKIKVLYTNNSSIEESNIISNFINLLNNLNIETSEVSTIDNASDDYILLEINSLKDIRLLHNNKLSGEAKIISSLLDIYLERYKIVKLSIPYDNKTMGYLQQIKEESFISITSLNSKSSISSLNYYGIVMITLTIMFSSVTGAYKIIKEKDSGTLTKIFTTSTSKFKILFGKLLSSSIFTFIEAFIVLFVSAKFLGLYIGNSPLKVLLILFLESIFSISLGLFIGYIVNDNKTAWLSLLLLIITFGFLGGAFVPLNTLNNDLLYTISSLSPLKYINSCILSIIYNTTESLLPVVLLITISSAILMKLTSVIMEVKK